MEIPLFPLSTILFPYGRMPLQIFEPRYLDLIKDCLRNNRNFGVVLILDGSSEVAATKTDVPSLNNLGTSARIIDWNQLPNGLLGITIQGLERFCIKDAWRKEDGLVIAKINLQEADFDDPMHDKWADLLETLERLKEHPHLQRMDYRINEKNAWEVGFVLAQILPLKEADKRELLGSENIENLMERLTDLLKKISG